MQKLGSAGSAVGQWQVKDLQKLIVGVRRAGVGRGIKGGEVWLR